MSLSDLIPRIEEGEGEDRELAVDVARALDYTTTIGNSVYYDSAGLTTSVDAVLALAERLDLNAMRLMDDALAAMMLCGWDTAKPFVHALARALLATVCRAFNAP